MDYIGRIFRPPSEAHSLLLQVTVGCSHNACTYCDMYRDKRFRPKELDRILGDIREAAALGPVYRRVFLCDGDALILSTERLLAILDAIATHMPWVQRVGVYGDTRSVLSKSQEELTALRQAGIGIVYHGMESGNDHVLHRIQKGGTRQQCIDTAAALRRAGITHSVIVLLGIGGMELSAAHASDTASALTAMDPPFVGALTTTIVPETPLHHAQQAGRFELPGKLDFIRELRTIVADSTLTACRFSSNHASNYLPLTCDLPRDKAAVVQTLDAVLARGDESKLKPEYLRGL